jgi:hypothetical protein
MVDPIYYRGITVTSQGFGVELDTNDIVRTLAAESKTKLAKVLQRAFPASGEKARKDLDNIVKDINISIANDTRKKILSAYKAGKKRGRQSYRFADDGKMKRYSDGRMEKGINNDRFIQATGTGITISLSTLDDYAKQWARLNFGAAPRSSKQVKDEKIKLFRKTLQDSPSLSRIGPRKAFRLPPTKKAVAVASNRALPSTPSPRSISQSGSGPYIYLYQYNVKGLPRRKFPSKATKGIQGWRFIDEGVSFMNKEYSKKLTAGLNQWIKELDNTISQAAATESSRPSRSATVTASPVDSGAERNTEADRRKAEADRQKRREAAKKGAETRKRNRQEAEAKRKRELMGKLLKGTKFFN